jgi:hypothetical protein
MKIESVLRTAAVAFPLVVLFASDGIAQVVSQAEQVGAAVMAAPEDQRADATVLGYGADGKLAMLRKGTNKLICLADDPKREGFEVDCYHESLEPYMARGRELALQGVKDRNAPRWEEAKNGKLKLPGMPAILYTLSGRSYNAETGTVENEYRRSTVYIPYATPETTGFSTQASTTDPWIMYPGTAGAHIMITPPRKTSGS